MYEFKQTQSGWTVYWGPAPAAEQRSGTENLSPVLLPTAGRRTLSADTPLLAREQCSA
jgi:hypothetical protein